MAKWQQHYLDIKLHLYTFSEQLGSLRMWGKWLSDTYLVPLPSLSISKPILTFGGEKPWENLKGGENVPTAHTSKYSSGLCCVSLWSLSIKPVESRRFVLLS